MNGAPLRLVVPGWPGSCSQNWRASIEIPGPGYYEIWARATDSEGVGQPHAIAWNPKGYLNSALHRVAVTVG